MFNVEKMWRRLCLSTWETRVKVSTFLTTSFNSVMVRWEKSNFARVLHLFYTLISTKIFGNSTRFLWRFLHIYT